MALGTTRAITALDRSATYGFTSPRYRAGSPKNPMDSPKKLDRQSRFSSSWKRIWERRSRIESRCWELSPGSFCKSPRRPRSSLSTTPTGECTTPTQIAGSSLRASTSSSSAESPRGASRNRGGGKSPVPRSRSSLGDHSQPLGRQTTTQTKTHCLHDDTRRRAGFFLTRKALFLSCLYVLYKHAKPPQQTLKHFNRLKHQLLLSQESIAEFQDLYCKEYGVILSVEEAQIKARLLLELFKILARPTAPPVLTSQPSLLDESPRTARLLLEKATTPQNSFESRLSNSSQL